MPLSPAIAGGELHFTSSSPTLGWFNRRVLTATQPPRDGFKYPPTPPNGGHACFSIPEVSRLHALSSIWETSDFGCRRDELTPGRCTEASSIKEDQTLKSFTALRQSRQQRQHPCLPSYCSALYLVWISFLCFVFSPPIIFHTKSLKNRG